MANVGVIVSPARRQTRHCLVTMGNVIKKIKKKMEKGRGKQRQRQEVARGSRNRRITEGIALVRMVTGGNWENRALGVLGIVAPFANRVVVVVVTKLMMFSTR